MQHERLCVRKHSLRLLPGQSEFEKNVFLLLGKFMSQSHSTANYHKRMSRAASGKLRKII